MLRNIVQPLNLGVQRLLDNPVLDNQSLNFPHFFINFNFYYIVKSMLNQALRTILE